MRWLIRVQVPVSAPTKGASRKGRPFCLRDCRRAPKPPTKWVQSPGVGTIWCCLNRCRQRNPRSEAASGFFMPIFKCKIKRCICRFSPREREMNLAPRIWGRFFTIVVKNLPLFSFLNLLNNCVWKEDAYLKIRICSFRIFEKICYNNKKVCKIFFSSESYKWRRW